MTQKPEVEELLAGWAAGALFFKTVLKDSKGFNGNFPTVSGLGLEAFLKYMRVCKHKSYLQHGVFHVFFRCVRPEGGGLLLSALAHLV